MHSTTTAALQLSDYLMETADKGWVPNSMFIDQSSAFDCIEAEILDRKLESYNFTVNSRKWIASYMSSRSQYVSIGAARSGIRTLKTGVPQGSVLGPVFYYLYTNELPELSKNSE